MSGESIGGSRPLSVARRLRVDSGLCGGCHHHDLLSSRTTTFLRCGRAVNDPRFDRYPALPVLSCPGFEAQRTGDE